VILKFKNDRLTRVCTYVISAPMKLRLYGTTEIFVTRHHAMHAKRANVLPILSVISLLIRC